MRGFARAKGLRGGEELNGLDCGECGRRAQALHPWHLFDPAQTAALLESSTAEGLSAPLAVARLAAYGPNRLPQAASLRPLRQA